MAPPGKIEEPEYYEPPIGPGTGRRAWCADCDKELMSREEARNHVCVMERKDGED